MWVGEFCNIPFENLNECPAGKCRSDADWQNLVNMANEKTYQL